MVSSTLHTKPLPAVSKSLKYVLECITHVWYVSIFRRKKAALLTKAKSQRLPFFTDSPTFLSPPIPSYRQRNDLKESDFFGSSQLQKEVASKGVSLFWSVQDER